MSVHHYLVFGDLHGRILPAFRLASAWSRDHKMRLDGLLQVGDLGFFPDAANLDQATRRHAEKDPLELGAADVYQRTALADRVFADPDVPDSLWFTLGNHEDFDLLADLRSGGDDQHFPVDFYLKVRCIRDGQVVYLPGGLRVAALWGIDGDAPGARRRCDRRAYIQQRAATRLACQKFDVLLTHDGPRDACIAGAGSLEINAILNLARPAFHFFGHYGSPRDRIEHLEGPTLSYHLAGMELRGRASTAEERSVGLLRWEQGQGQFEYLDPCWLQTFTRFNWKHR